MNIVSTARTVFDHHVVFTDQELEQVRSESPTFAALLKATPNGQSEPAKAKG